MLEIKNAAHAKQLLAKKLLGQSGHQIVVSEIGDFNKPDILSMTRSDMLIEYEIKLSRADLMGELNSVKTVKNAILMRTHNQQFQGPQQMELGGKTINAHIRGNVFEPEGLYENIGKCSKLDKHERYLMPKPQDQSGLYDYSRRAYRPNQFYFAVTADLVDIAIEVCEGLPYGVLDLNGVYGSSSIKKRAGWLHRDEPTKYELQHMAHILSFAYWLNVDITKESEKAL